MYSNVSLDLNIFWLQLGRTISKTHRGVLVLEYDGIHWPRAPGEVKKRKEAADKNMSILVRVVISQLQITSSLPGSETSNICNYISRDISRSLAKGGFVQRFQAPETWGFLLPVDSWRRYLLKGFRPPPTVIGVFVL